MTKEVKISDREYSIEYLRMALNMCEIYVNYQQTELIFKVINKCDLLRGDFSVEDACDLLSVNKAKWDKYFNEEKIIKKNQTKKLWNQKQKKSS